jgi:hypothetical protein
MPDAKPFISMTRAEAQAHLAQDGGHCIACARPTVLKQVWDSVGLERGRTTTVHFWVGCCQWLTGRLVMFHKPANAHGYPHYQKTLGIVKD